MKIQRIGLFSVCFFFTTISYAQRSVSEGIVWGLDEQPGIREHFVYGLAVAKDGSILAFSEGRISPGDASPHHIVLKRSIDTAASWQPSKVLVRSTNGECYANPTPVVDPKTGEIFLFYALNNENKTSKVFYIRSSDHGVTWSIPTEVTSLFDSDPLKRPFHLPGPGHGIALKNGRLMLQVWHRYSVEQPIPDRKYGISVIYSDDHGRSWKPGGYIPHSDSFPANESRLLQLADGKLLLDSRFAANNGEVKRIQYFSSDKGKTWSAPSSGAIPAFTSVDAGLHAINQGGKFYMIFTRPVGPGRNNFGISFSEDNGRSWSPAKIIFDGPANYSDVAILPDKTIFVLYGRGKPRYAAWARFSLDWLKNGD